MVYAVHDLLQEGVVIQNPSYEVAFVDVHSFQFLCWIRLRYFPQVGIVYFFDYFLFLWIDGMIATNSVIIFIYLLYKSLNPATARSTRVNAKERERKERQEPRK